MIKLTILLTRRADLTHDEFIEYWTGKHTQMIASMPNTSVIAKKYVQLLPTADALPGVNLLPCDAIAEIWMNSLDDAKTLFTSGQYLSDVAKDEENFLDRSKTQFFIANERAIIGT